MTVLDWLTNGFIIATVVAITVLLWQASVRSSETWRAALTPLASIIAGFSLAWVSSTYMT